ncbi:MAG: PEP-CTERM sorting domain-containing protein [Armatimonadetes bacterium]|nr:PEP-CTERM sorting domain-containing protein [Armatimonadota bacterium]
MRSFTFVGLVAGSLSLAAGSQAAIVDVNVFDFDFSVNAPGQTVVDAVIDVGDTVRWVFLADFHTTTSVVGSAESWDSGMLMDGSTFSHSFGQVGVFTYYCQMHGFDMGNGTAGGMAGTVTVNPVPEPVSGLVLAGSLGAFARRKRRSQLQ